MVTARYSNQQGSKSRQNPCQVQPTENIANLSASRPGLFGYELQFLLLLSGVLPVVQNLNYYKLQRIPVLPDVLPNQQSHQKGYKQFSSSGRVTRRQVMRYFTSNGTDQSMSKRFIKSYYISRATSIDSDCCRLSTAGQSSQQQSGQITLQSVLIDKPKFLKATHHTEK